MTSPDVASARPARPGAVTVAYWLQLAAVAVLLVLVCLLIVDAVRYDAQIDDVLRRVPDADPTEVSDERIGNLIGALFFGIPALLLTGWLAATAYPLRRGSTVARILVFVAAGGEVLVWLGQACLAVAVMAGDYPDSADWEQSRFLDTLYAQPDPGLLTGAVVGIGVLLVVLLTAAVVVLLLMPGSRRWFGGPAALPPAGGWPVHHYGYGYGVGQYGWPTPYWPAPPGYPSSPDPALHPVHPPAGASGYTVHPADPRDGEPTPPGATPGS